MNTEVEAKILVVDDNPKNLLAMGVELEGQDAELFTASSGNEALAMLLRHEFALVLLDIQMPGMDGFEVARAIHSNNKTKDTPIIFVTANANDEASVNEGYATGAIDYITKPINTVILSGKVRAFISLYKTQKKVELILKKAKRLSDEANRTKSEFLANMSHELRTPLTAVIGYAEKITDSDISEVEKINAANTIVRNGEHLLDIINDLLDLSKIEFGNFDIEIAPASLPELIESIVTLMRAKATEKGLAFEIIQDSPIPEKIRTDSTRLRQILLNLISNAIKFTSTGKVQLRLSLEEDLEKMRFDVIDTGIGITPEQQGKLFSPFTQANLGITREYGGTGLGLSISQGLSEQLGGEISFKSQVGKGSTFTVSVATGPLDSISMIESISKVLSSNKKPSAPNPKPARSQEKLSGSVLLAEDCEDNRALITHYLKKAGVKVSLAENGQEALEMVSNDNFDVILMDMQMPVLDGHEATKLLRERGCQIPIVALTAEAMKHHINDCLEEGCSDHLAKPFHRNQLIEMVRKHLQ